MSAASDKALICSLFTAKVQVVCSFTAVQIRHGLEYAKHVSGIPSLLACPAAVLPGTGSRLVSLLPVWLQALDVLGLC